MFIFVKFYLRSILAYACKVCYAIGHKYTVPGLATVNVHSTSCKLLSVIYGTLYIVYIVITSEVPSSFRDQLQEPSSSSKSIKL